MNKEQFIQMLKDLVKAQEIISKQYRKKMCILEVTRILPMKQVILSDRICAN